MEIKELSVFTSDSGKRKAVVSRNVESGQYHVTVMNDMGSTFTSVFSNIDDAEDHAENWVML
jgi:hypothetical protein